MFVRYQVAFAALASLASASALAAPTFHVDPNTPSGTVLTNLDQVWHDDVDAGPTSLGLDQTEWDFNWTNGSAVDSVTTNHGVLVDFSLGGLNGFGPAGTIFWGWWWGGGGPIYGVFSGGSLEAIDGNGGHSRLVMDFSEPVYGVGTWIFDDGSQTVNGTTLTVVEIDGTETTSSLLDSGNGAPHRIEGHLGVTSDIGIVQAWIDNIDLDTNGQADCCLELDHLKVAEPTAPSDDDGDGVFWGTDFCPGSAVGEPVDVNGCDCDQLADIECPPNDPWSTPGAYSSCVAQVTGACNSGNFTLLQTNPGIGQGMNNASDAAH